MKSRNLYFGIIILFIGVIALLSSLHVINFNWHSARTLWPIILVVVGISMLPLKDYLKGILLVLTLGAACLIYHFESQHPERYPHSAYSFFNRQWDCDDDKTDYYDSESYYDDTDDEDAKGASVAYEGDTVQQFSSAYEAVHNAHLDIEIGAGKLELKSPCAELILAETRSDFARYTFRNITIPDESLSKVSIKQKSSHHSLKGKINNKVDVKLCDTPIWDFDIETGASTLNLDFSPYKTGNIEIDAGVCDIDIKMGDKLADNSVLDIESGVSDITIKVPENIGCTIDVESALTNKNFIGFEKKNRHKWQTSNYDNAEKHLTIKLSCGVSNIDISRF